MSINDKTEGNFLFFGQKGPTSNAVYQRTFVQHYKKFQTESKVEKNFTVNTHTSSHEDPTNSIL